MESLYVSQINELLYSNLTVNDAGRLCVAGYDTVELALEYGTPLLLLDENMVRARCRAYREAAAESFPAGSLPLYASKALSFKRMYQIADEEGLGADVVSPGELYTAHAAGFPMEKVYFHGNNKTDADIAFAIAHGVGCIVCDNKDELAAIDREAARAGTVQPLLLRLTPGIDPHTHEKINTGRVDSKFGAAIETGQAEALLLHALSLRHVRVLGLHCHVGSQIFDPKPLADAAAIMLRFLAEMKEKHGYEAQTLNLGGGMGVPYLPSDPKIDYAQTVRALGRLVDGHCRSCGLTPPAILLEPGRSLVADAGVTLYTAGGVKRIPGFKNYVSVDGGMGDNPRYALYGAEHTVYLASRMNAAANFRCTVAGRCCESGDVLREDALLPEPRRGDILAVLTTGAYCYSMASNYNRFPRPPVILLGPNGPYVGVRRESFDDLIRNDL